MATVQVIDIESTKFKCFEKYILVAPVIPEQTEKTSSGIIVEMKKDLFNSRPCSGRVVNSSNDSIKEGDFVVFPSTDGIDCKFTDGEFMLLKVESIIGKGV